MKKNKLEKNAEKNKPVVKANSGAKKIKKSSPELHGQSNILQNLGRIGPIFLRMTCGREYCCILYHIESASNLSP